MTSFVSQNLFSIKGYVAVVTGGSSGIGYMISRGLVANGARVYIVALDPLDEQVMALNELGKESGGTAHGMSCDVSDKDEIAKLLAYISEREDHVDMLVSNAGIRRDPPQACSVLEAPLAELQASLWSSPMSDWVDTFKVNTTAHYFLTVAFLKLLDAAAQRDLGDGRVGRSEGRGMVLLMSSCASMHNATNVDLTSYATSKAATDHLVRLLAAKLSRFYIRVVGMNPGFVPSNMNKIGQEDNIFSNLFDKVPAKRAGDEQDMIGTVLFLASRAGMNSRKLNAAISNHRIEMHNCKIGAFRKGVCVSGVGGADESQDPGLAAASDKMSIISLSDDVKSNLSTEDIKILAGQLNAPSIEEKDAQDYLTVLRSFEAIMGTIENAPDYVPTELRPQASTNPRTCWRPKTQDNPCNAWSHRCHILSQSPATDLLAGRTVAIKDNVSVAGLPTTLGVPATLFSKASHPVADIDSSVVSRILNAGAIISGTSTCESFCASTLSFTSASGLVHNPHLRNYTSGGSSSGSAVLVASHALKSKGSGVWGETVEMAVGSDQAGSVRIPASYCGIYGLKPTFGLVPYTGAISMTPMIDHLGPMGNTLEDVAALLEVMAGYDGFDPRMSPETPLPSHTTPYLSILSTLRHEISSSLAPGKNLRVGLLEESFSLAGVSDQVRSTVTRSARDYFEAVGATVVGVSVPMHLQGPAIWTAAARPSMSCHLFQGLPLGHLSYLPGHARMRWPPSQSTLDTLKVNNPGVVNILLSELYTRNMATPGLEAKAHRKVFELRAAYDAAFANVDVLVTPCAPTVAMPHPDLDASILERLKVGVGVTSNTCPFNITGHPAMNVPCGFGRDARQPDVPLPIGMQIVGRRWADDQVIRAAALFEHGKQLFGKNQGAGNVEISQH